MSFKGFISVAFALVLLIGLFLVFPKSASPGKQEPSRFTGYPTWHSLIKDNDQQKVDSFAAYDSIVLLVATVLTFKWAFVDKLPKKVVSHFHSDEGTVPTTPLNRFISLYCLGTFVAVVASIAFDVGKLWSVFGALHNLFEVAILLLIGQNGKIKGNSYYYLWGAYYLIINSASVSLDFPLDAIFFKVQGLSVDYAVVIEYTRVLFTTKKNLSGQGELQLPFNADEHDDDALSTFAIHHPKQWLLIIAAAGVHLAGNIFNTLAPNDAKTNYLFQLSYAITFLLYLLYVYFDTHTISVNAPKRFYLPETSGAKAAVLAIISLWLSLSTLAVGIALQGGVQGGK